MAASPDRTVSSSRYGASGSSVRGSSNPTPSAAGTQYFIAMPFGT